MCIRDRCRAWRRSVAPCNAPQSSQRASPPRRRGGPPERQSCPSSSECARGSLAPGRRSSRASSPLR
eukprot:4067320-Alexandrium_andersonii.AAC.1